MAYRKPTDLDGFIQWMPKTDMRIKAQLAEDLLTFLSDDKKITMHMDMGSLIDCLMPWLRGSHFKIAQKSLEAFSELIKRLGPAFNAHVANLLPHVIDRLGDSHDVVRQKAQLVLRDMLEHKVLSPQAMLDKLASSCFKHKNAKVREEFLQTIMNTLNEYNSTLLTVRNYIPSICTLLGDSTATVRETAIQTLVEIYKQVGDRLRPDLRRMDNIHASKLSLLEHKFDQVQAEDLRLNSASDADNNGFRERPTKITKRPAQSVSRLRPKPNMNDVPGDAGAVSMELFEASFEIVKQITVYHPKDLDDVYMQVLLVISDKNVDWEKRVDALKKIRALLMLNYHAQLNFAATKLIDLSNAFLDVLKEELRSQVIREACITIAYMSKTLRNRLDTFCVNILNQLIMLIRNAAKVIASSSVIALKFIIKYTHSPKLIKIITDNVQQSKSKDIRSTLCEVMVMLFEEWQSKSLEKHAIVLRDTLKKSISDADCDARRHSRIAYWAFRTHFPDLANQIYGSLDIAAQRALERERAGGSMAMKVRRKTASRFLRSTGSLHKLAAGKRSISAAAAPTAQRDKGRSQYSVLEQQKPFASSDFKKPATNGSLPRLRSKSHQPASVSSGVSPRTRCRGGVSQSKSMSRSVSLSSKLREYNFGDTLSPGGGQQPKCASMREYPRNGMRMGRKLLSRDEYEGIGSEASSVLSARTFDSSYRRNTCNHLRSASRNRLDYISTRVLLVDIERILQYCASTFWSERKEGLISLTKYLGSGKKLTGQQLQCVLEMFRKMFMDPQVKVYSLFLDTVTELVIVHAPDLHGWLFILLTKLFNRLGTESLSSMHGKIFKTLTVVREFFPKDLQLKEVFRIISDSTQTPTTKSKLAILHYLTDLANTYCKGSDFPLENGPACEKTIAKLAQMDCDSKSIELQSQARLCLIALYNLNRTQMIKLLAALPGKDLQENARMCIHSHLLCQTTSTGTNLQSCSSVQESFCLEQTPILNTSSRSHESSVEKESVSTDSLDERQD